MENLKKRTQDVYHKFFDELNVEYDKGNTIGLTGSGLWKNAPKDRELRFATMPHIGENYLNAPKKVLFVGYDIGNDEIGKIQSFEDRHFSSVDLTKIKSPHIAGTYMETLYIFSQFDDKYKEIWSYFSECTSPNDSTLRNAADKIHLDSNLLSYVAQTNLYKFVTVGRGKANESGSKNGRRGASDRDWFGYREEIENLLIEEIKILKPDIIWFQGLYTINDSIWKKMVANCNWSMSKYHSYHPADFKHGSNTPKYISEIISMEVK